MIRPVPSKAHLSHIRKECVDLTHPLWGNWSCMLAITINENVDFDILVFKGRGRSVIKTRRKGTIPAPAPWQTEPDETIRLMVSRRSAQWLITKRFLLMGMINQADAWMTDCCWSQQRRVCIQHLWIWAAAPDRWWAARMEFWLGKSAAHNYCTSTQVTEVNAFRLQSITNYFKTNRIQGF